MVSDSLKRLGIEAKNQDGLLRYAVPGDVFFDLLEAAIGTIEFDEAFYLKKYEDVARVVARGEFASAREHYVKFGFHENRQPYDIEVDEEYYRTQNPDVAEAIDEGVFPSCRAHFDRSGFAEGRLPYAGFRLFRGA